MRTPRPTRAHLSVVVALVLITGACGSGSSSERVRLPAPSDPPGLKSIVQLGDSVASGEGTLFGYTYDPASQKWTGGDLSVKWPGPYPDCHDSPDAYGQIVATEVEADLAQFGCTGASFANGIVAAEVVKGYFENTTLRPAQFGNWDTQQDLNADYDAAAPDLVLITLGADDLMFVAMVEACIENAYLHATGVALQCVADNPGPTVQRDFFDQLPTLQQNYRTLVSWIQARGQKAGKVPKILFTNYHDPLPTGGAGCPDDSYLNDRQVPYLSSLLAQLNQVIISTIQGLGDPGVAVADVSQSMAGSDGTSHRWCSADPWAYGLSIYDNPFNFQSPAPFHPTPEGHKRIAQLVLPVVDRLFATSPSTTEKP